MNHLVSSENIATLNQALSCLKTGEPVPIVGSQTRNWSERCVEVPWAASFLGESKKLLDVGWSMSPPEWLGVLLAARAQGVELTGIDIIDPQRVKSRYPENLVDQVFEVPVRVENVLQAEPQGSFFDMITCISTLEHIGFDFASPPENNQSVFSRANSAADADSERDPDTDAQFLAATTRLLAPGGSLLISVPAGSGGPILHQDSLGYFTHQFEYDPKSWGALISDPRYRVESALYYRLDTNKGWHKVESCEELADQTSVLKPFATGCAMVHLIKN
jgi:2-polyprenyl-3-methyl-5-hydroxy-6-metoxy-1,4-benzoquinol methylase